MSCWHGSCGLDVWKIFRCAINFWSTLLGSLDKMMMRLNVAATTGAVRSKEVVEKDSTITTTVRLALAIHSEEATKETKDSAKDTTKARERTKENKQQIHATDVEEQDILPKIAEWQFTILDKENALTLRMQLHNGTTTTMTMDGTVRTTQDNNKDNSH